MPEVRAILVHSLGNVRASLRGRIRIQWFNWLGWRQWLVLFMIGATVIAIELRNHNIMWQKHESGQTVWTDPELIVEIILFGLVIPILGGLVLGYVTRTAIERDELTRALELQRALVGQMRRTQSWHELSELVVTTTGNITSADRVWLLAKRSAEEEFDQVAYWERPGSGLLTTSPPAVPAACERCLETSSLKGTKIQTCHHADSGSSASRSTRYCLWLSSEGTAKAVLLFDMPSGRPLDAAQMKVLDDLSDEMSLAIDNANLHYVEQRKVDVARNERLRIARDLHDTLGQNISYLHLKLEQLSATRQAPGRTALQDELAKMLAVAEEAYEQVRDTLEELRTTEQQDLEETVRLYAAQAAERGGFSVEVNSSGQPGTLSTRRSRQMIYIAREALNNVEKHASAQNVDIHLQWSDGEFRLTVRDDGKGFQPENLNIRDRYGMVIMGERCRAINADLAIESVPGEGTELTVSLPMSGGAITAS